MRKLSKILSELESFPPSIGYRKHLKFADATIDLHPVQLLGGLSKSAQDYGKEVD